MTSYYCVSWPDSAIQFAEKGLALADKLKLPTNQIDLHSSVSIAYVEKGNFSLGLEHAFKAMEIAKRIKDKYYITQCNIYIGIAYSSAGDYRKALFYHKLVLHSLENLSRSGLDERVLMFLLGQSYYELQEFDSALFYTKQSYDLDIVDSHHWPVPYLYMGKLAEHKGQFIEALSFYKASISREISDVAQADYIKGYMAIAGILEHLNKYDSSIYYAKKAYQIANSTSLYSYSYQASELLKLLYKQNNQIDSAFKYQELMVVEKDSLFNRDRLSQMQRITYEDEKRQNSLKAERERLTNQIKLYSLISSLVVILTIVFLLVRNSLFKQRAFNLLQKQKSDLDVQKSKAEQMLIELRATQSQLIQSEKMASLGELTAGIAHEIQNPLNFVNNFSEVNTELIDELEVEINRGDFEEAKAIAKDIKENEQKINHHGRRADAIVKGMLQHSRSSSGVKEPTDINALCDEYLRLAYHGLRAKDNTFNAKFGTSFDESLDKVEVIPQDIGRVILNLITNAFYAVIEKKRQSSDGYEPMVTVTTIHSRTSPGAAGGEVLIKVKDNGNGIPQNVMDKIFQPFFTTKPTGQGT
ncbi:MAG: ATP-binding protein, partial [Cyclobacteriaceae bacterium]|nr:ATP-binding protein [Cyclobacteriaceae bacterium]